MRSNPIPLITICLLVSFSSLAQGDSRYNLLLKTGTITPPQNITTEKLNQFNRNAARTEEKTFAIIQFEQLPTENEKQQLKQSGIELLDYVPNNAYTVTITGLLNESVLLQTNVIANENQTLDFSELANGVYILKVANDKSVTVKKIVLNK